MKERFLIAIAGCRLWTENKITIIWKLLENTALNDKNTEYNISWRSNLPVWILKMDLKQYLSQEAKGTYNPINDVTLVPVDNCNYLSQFPIPPFDAAIVCVQLTALSVFGLDSRYEELLSNRKTKVVCNFW